jgi:hypothetical protein
MDIRPASSIGARIMINHVTGVVIGETAATGYVSTILLHGIVGIFFLLITLTQSSILVSPSFTQ